MPRSENQKIKILYLMRMLLERTDSSHIITMQEILAELKQHDISAERKSIYNDIHALREFGMDIELKKGPPAGYCLASRWEAAQPLREEAAGEKAVGEKTVGEETEIPDNLNLIHKAILTDSGISFRYFSWSVDKTPKMKRDGGQYEVSPWELVRSEGDDYLAAYDSSGKKMKLYRVDKMVDLELTGRPREGSAEAAASHVAGYWKKTFGMMDGEEKTVTLRMDNSLADTVIDRFGTDIPLRPVGKDAFQARVTVRVSARFYGWLTGLGKGARIVAPQEEADRYRKYLKRLLKEYK